MASLNNETLLGYIDEQINSENSKGFDYTWNKIGGRPVWCTGVAGQQPFCIKCKKKMLFVAQIHADLGIDYDRILYIFACITPECWNKPHSWVCLRSQKSKRSTSTSASSSSKAIATDMWLSDQEDWGSSDEDDGNGNTDNFSFISQQLDNKALPAFLKNSVSDTTKRNDNLNQINANTTASIAQVVKNIEIQMNINEDNDNANEACGAVALQMNTGGGTEASALIEGPEDDIAVESPELPTVDIPALLKEAVRVEDPSEKTFIGYFISSDFEPPERKDFSEHERELCHRYEESSRHNEDMTGISEAQGGDGVYEKSIAHHGDILFYKFKKRIMRSPHQILRYYKDKETSPLWLYPPPKERPACVHCKGPLFCELQIMPQLINYLRILGTSSPILEFGTIVIYTCLSSCWKEGDLPKQELTFVQAGI